MSLIKQHKDRSKALDKQALELARKALYRANNPKYLLIDLFGSVNYERATPKTSEYYWITVKSPLDKVLGQLAARGWVGVKYDTFYELTKLKGTFSIEVSKDERHSKHTLITAG